MAKKVASTKPNELAKRLNISTSVGKTDKVLKPQRLRNNPLYNALNPNQTKNKVVQVKINPLARALSSKPQKAKGSISKKSENPKQAKVEDDFSFKSKDRDEINFKEASRPKFLRIYNLQSGTTIADVETVVSKVSPVKKVLLKPTSNTKIMCEVFFKRGEKILPFVLDKFNNKKLDGNVLKCEIDNKSKILKVKQYDEFLKELK